LNEHEVARLADELGGVGICGLDLVGNIYTYVGTSIQETNSHKRLFVFQTNSRTKVPPFAILEDFVRFCDYGILQVYHICILPKPGDPAISFLGYGEKINAIPVSPSVAERLI
jgi:hypothetical protein